MNTTILAKCVDELRKESPNIAYVLGMLETIIAMSGQTYIPLPAQPDTLNVKTIIQRTEEVSDETVPVNPVVKAGPIGRLTQS